MEIDNDNNECRNINTFLDDYLYGVEEEKMRKWEWENGNVNILKQEYANIELASWVWNARL